MPKNNNQPRLQVLVFCDYFSPSTKAGGALRSLINLIEKLGDEVDYHLVTRDHDLGSNTPYPGITSNRWTQTRKASALYLSRGFFSLLRISKTIRNSKIDIIYFNSLFSPIFTFYPLLLLTIRKHRIPQIIIAPRGELGEGALSLKQQKKRVYLNAIRHLSLVERTVWHASTNLEVMDIRRHFPDAKIQIAGDMSSAAFSTNRQGVEKTPGSLKVVFLSRISPVKNLLFVLDTIDRIDGEIELDIYGPIENSEYWAECKKRIARAPSNLKIRYRGEVPHAQVTNVLAEYHLFYLPTRGENFGHAILEAMLSGCPVLISDKTPWRNLENATAGRDLPLVAPDAFVQTLQQFTDMHEERFRKYSNGARKLASAYNSNDAAFEQNKKLFRINQKWSL